MTQLTGQLALFDTQQFPTFFDSESYEIAYCPACHSNWGAEHARSKPRVQTKLNEDHEMMADDRCAFMHRHSITEPFYTLREVGLVRQGGWPLPYPRPEGFGGLYQLR